MKRYPYTVLCALVLLGCTSCQRGSARPAAEAAPAPLSPPSANVVISAALKNASAEHKVVLIEFGASWCTWCRRFNDFVHAPKVSSIVSANYIVVNLVVQERDDKKALENPGGQDVMNQWGGAKAGLPFYVFLDSSGAKLADSNALADGTNVGFPGNAKEVAVFLGLLDKTAPRMTAAEREEIAGYLEASVAS